MDFIGQIINAIIDVHPWHVPLVHFPIGLSGAAFLFILIAFWRRNSGLEYAAFSAITLVAITSVLAGVTGIRDNIVRFEGTASFASVKIVLAVLLLVLSGAMAYVRWRRGPIAWRPATRALALVAFGATFLITLVLGFLGGVILYGL